MKDLVESIRPMVEQLTLLQQQAEEQWLIAFEEIERNKRHDVEEIEFILDRLIDIAESGIPRVLFKRICRYLYSFAPEVAISHVHFWRELWDEESLVNVEERGNQ